jgi:hypothetical protein
MSIVARIPARQQAGGSYFVTPALRLQFNF